jgi:chitodextrinase
MSFASEQLYRIETLLAENPGVKTVAVGNTTVTYEDLLKQYEYWKNLVDREAGRRPGAKQINLSGF